MADKKNLNQKELEKVTGGVEDSPIPTDEQQQQEQEERNLVQTILDAYKKLLEGKYK